MKDSDFSVAPLLRVIRTACCRSALLHPFFRTEIEALKIHEAGQQKRKNRGGEHQRRTGGFFGIRNQRDKDHEKGHAAEFPHIPDQPLFPQSSQLIFGQAGLASFNFYARIAPGQTVHRIDQQQLYGD